MIIPSIDLMNGNAVQLIGGEKKAIDAGDPRPIANEFGLVGEVALIDLDAALGTGNNKEVMHEIIASTPCRVGGGIRDVKTAIEWLDAGAEKIIIGTAAVPKMLKELPKERVIAALDARHDRVVVEGWVKNTGESIEDRMDALREYVSGFLVTFVELEGRMGGLPFERIRELAEYSGDCKLTVAGGVRTVDDIAVVDQMGVDAQVGMALYTKNMDLAEGYCSVLKSDRPDGLWPTIVCDELGTTLGLVYSSIDSIREAIQRKRGVYFSRSRNGIWVKGESSGNTQELLSIDTDCDRDALKFTVKQSGTGFCHTGTSTCFGQSRGLTQLESTVKKRVINAPTGSYTRRLLDDPDLLKSKLIEEAGELADSISADHAADEFADVVYFSLVKAVQQGASLSDLNRVLDRRACKITRRAGDAKLPVGDSL
jgi:phosphoribosylformimino-5-aminoimidazole carboxamide ribotide isomerase